MLTMKDLDCITKYKEAIKSSHPIRIDKYGNYEINITCKETCDKLRNIGFTNRKSYEVDFQKIISNVPEHLMHHFVRGMFDGDGSIRIYKYDYIKNPQLHFGFTGLYEIVSFVKDYLNIKTKTVKESNITYTCVSSCKETIKNIFNILYKDATIYIDRKYETFKQIA